MRRSCWACLAPSSWRWRRPASWKALAPASVSSSSARSSRRWRGTPSCASAGSVCSCGSSAISWTRPRGSRCSRDCPRRPPSTGSPARKSSPTPWATTTCCRWRPGRASRRTLRSPTLSSATLRSTSKARVPCLHRLLRLVPRRPRGTSSVHKKTVHTA